MEKSTLQNQTLQAEGLNEMRQERKERKIYYEFFAKEENNYPIGKLIYFKTVELTDEGLRSELLNLNYQETKRRFFEKK